MRINNTDGLEYEVGVLMAKAIKDENYDYELAKAMLDKFSGLDITHMAEGIEAELEGFTEATVTDVLEQFGIDRWVRKIYAGNFNEDDILEGEFQDTIDKLNEKFKLFKLHEYFEDTITVYIGENKDIYMLITSDEGENGTAVLYKLSGIDLVSYTDGLEYGYLDMDESQNICDEMTSYVNSL